MDRKSAKAKNKCYRNLSTITVSIDATSYRVLIDTGIKGLIWKCNNKCKLLKINLWKILSTKDLEEVEQISQSVSWLFPGTKNHIFKFVELKSF